LWIQLFIFIDQYDGSGRCWDIWVYVDNLTLIGFKKKEYNLGNFFLWPCFLVPPIENHEYMSYTVDIAMKWKIYFHSSQKKKNIFFSSISFQPTFTCKFFLNFICGSHFKEVHKGNQGFWKPEIDCKQPPNFKSVYYIGKYWLNPLFWWIFLFHTTFVLVYDATWKPLISRNSSNLLDISAICCSVVPVPLF